ncbi:MAG: hypothetical protein AAGC64_03205 [Bacteroidota bacterium]
MSANRSNISISRTLLILLGIILACLIALNARSFYSVENLSFPKQNQPNFLDKKASVNFLKDASKIALEKFGEKTSSLK